ncbi:MAG: GGDEF domain-containing protein [Treponemataceae bacterium]|nr:GGDEF domain-containing protein [Treponemataceae bacterium]
MERAESKNIAILLSTLHDEYQKTLVSCFTKAAEKRNFHLSFFAGYSLCSPYGYQAASNSIYALIHRSRFAGVVISSTLFTYIDESTIRTFLTYLEQEKIPFIVFSYNIKGYFRIKIDAEKAIHTAIEHLAQDHGAKRIGFIRGPKNSEEANERFFAYQRGLERCQLPYEQDLILQGDYGRFSGYHVIDEYIATGKVLPDAILAANDLMALGVLECLQHHGIAVPQQVKIIGFDDIGESAISIPALSTIRQPLQEMAAATLDYIEFWNEKTDAPDSFNTFPSEISIEASFIRRESCGCFDAASSFSYPSFFVLQQSTNNIPRDPRGIIAPQEKGGVTSQNMKRPSPETLEDLTESNLLFHFDTVLAEVVAEKRSPEELKRIVLQSFPQIALLESHLLELQRTFFSSEENGLFQTKVAIIFELLAYIHHVKERLLLRQSYSFVSHLQDFEYASQFITVSFNLQDLITNLKNTLSRLNIENFFLCVYSGTVHWDKRLSWKLPAKSKVILFYQQGLPVSSWENRTIYTRTLYPHGFLDNKNTSIFLPLYYEFECLGFLGASPVPEDSISLSILRREAAMVIKGTLLLEKEERTKTELKESLGTIKTLNRRLHTLSIIDELTGLYNRRGFIIEAQKILNWNKGHARPCLLFFFDVNGLKRINDHYGHREGDFAIKSIATVLQRSFRSTDILGRWGGDELVVLAIDCTFEELPTMQKRLQENIETINKKAQKPYSISFCYGVAATNIETPTNLQELLDMADKNLYDEKARFYSHHE